LIAARATDSELPVFRWYLDDLLRYSVQEKVTGAHAAPERNIRSIVLVVE
jgi:hypothetical protein